MVSRASSAEQLPDNVVSTTTSDGPTEDPANARLRARRDRFAAMETFWSQIHTIGRDDDRFVSGDQWPDDIKKDREEEGRPCLTYNLMPGFTRQIINKVRQERPQMRVVPVESDRHQTPDVTNVQGTKDYSLSDVYMGIIRNIEHNSRADHAYDTALQHATHHGFGYFYMTAAFSSMNPFVQDLLIRRVKDSYSVLLDPSSQMADYSDAQDAFMFSSMSRAAFERKYPEAPIGQFNDGSGSANYGGWYSKDEVRIAQYFWIDYIQDEVLLLTNGKIVYHSEVKDVLDELEEQKGILIARESEAPGAKEMRKKVKRPRCMWVKMTADHELEGPKELVFRRVPIFPVLGDELVIDGRVIYESAIRHAKDPQRSYNYWRTAAAETVALAPRAPWIIADQQIEGHEDEWESANTHNLPYLSYKHIEGVNPPQRTFPSQQAVAELANARQDAYDMQTIIGLHEASLGAESNEKSGKAILARQAQGSTATYTFPDNLNRALEACGRCAIEAIPRVYDTQRVMRIRLPDDTDDFVEINQIVRDEEGGEEHLVHDLGYGQYDCVVETGPSYATQRQEALEVQLDLLGKLPPEMASMIVHLVVKNMSLPGSEEIYRILRKALPDHLKSEDERAADLPRGVIFDAEGNPVHEESGEPYQPPLTPQEQLRQKEAQVAELEHTAKIEKAQADKAQAEADMREAEAKIAELQAAGATSAEDQAGELAGKMMPEVERIIREVMKEHEQNPEAHKVALDAQLPDQLVETLTRVRAYVDRRLAAEGNQAEREPAEA